MERTIPKLGVGLPYMAALPADIYASGLIDFVEMTPETICRQRPKGHRIAMEIEQSQMDQALRACAALPLVIHGVELSIGSAPGWNGAYIEMLDEFQARWPFVWHSEHLSFQTMVGEDGARLEVGVPLPLPPTRESGELVAERSAEILQRYGVPFLLENPAHYLPGLPSDPEVGDDIGLMNAIVRSSGCYQLLDLHNIHCNAINHGFDPFAAVDRVLLSSVGEIHVAGGSWSDGFWMDAHDGRVPERVWDLLEYVLPRCENVGGLVFEMLEDHAVRLGWDVIQGELQRATQIWRRFGGKNGLG
jgi:uncharacterized protein